MFTTLILFAIKRSTSKSFQIGDVFGLENDGSDDMTTLIDRKVNFPMFRKRLNAWFHIAEKGEV
jgi:hypothetical protein